MLDSSLSPRAADRLARLIATFAMSNKDVQAYASANGYPLRDHVVAFQFGMAKAELQMFCYALGMDNPFAVQTEDSKS
jgi:hypothetical protein